MSGSFCSRRLGSWPGRSGAGHNFRYIDPAESADEEMLPILDSPDALQIVAGGGDAGAMVMIVPIYGLGLHASSVTRKIRSD